MTTADAQPSAAWQPPFALLPARAFDNFLDALRQAVALHAQAIDGHARWLEQIALADLGRIKPQLGGQFVQL